MKRNLLIFLFVIGFLSFVVIASAVDFIPQGNIDLKDTYNITGAPYVNATIYYGNGSQLTGILTSGGEADFNVNSSDYWDNMDSINTTQMENSGGILNILVSWVTGLFSGNYYNKTETYSKSEVDTNFTYYLLLTDQRYNETDLLNSINTTANIKSLGFYDKTEVDNNLSNYILSSEEGNLNTNSTTWWATVSGYVSKWFYKSGNNLALNETELNNSIDARLVTTFYNATQSTMVVGTIDGGSLADTHHQDGAYDGVTFNFSEESGSPGLDLRMNFTGIEDFNRGIIRYKTSTIFGDYPIIQLWDYDGSAWEDYPPIGEGVTFATITQPVFDSSEHISGGVVQMRLYKASNGNTQNHYYIDWVAISKGPGIPSGQEVDPYSIHTDAINDTQMNYTSGKLNIIVSWLTGLFYTESEIDTKLAAQDDCSEINNCVDNAWDANADIDADEIDEAKINFDTPCAAGNHLYVSGDNLACEADDDTTYTNGSGLSLVGTEFNHTDTSSQASDDNSGNTFIQDIILDTFGHITSIVNAAVDFSSYVAISNLVGMVGNWSADKSSYWDTSNDLDTVISNDEIAEGKIAFSTACAAGNHYYLSGNDLACEADDDTTYSAGANLSLDGTTFSLDATNVKTWLDTLYAAIGDANPFGSKIDDTEMANEDFGEFTCTSNEDGCTLDSGVYDDEYIELGDSFSGEVTGVYGSLVIGNDVLDDQYYDSESDLTNLLDDNYEGAASHFDVAATTNITCLDDACNWFTNATDSCMYWPSGGKDCGAA